MYISEVTIKKNRSIKIVMQTKPGSESMTKAPITSDKHATPKMMSLFESISEHVKLYYDTKLDLSVRSIKLTQSETICPAFAGEYIGPEEDMAELKFSTDHIMAPPKTLVSDINKLLKEAKGYCKEAVNQLELFPAAVQLKKVG